MPVDYVEKNWDKKDIKDRKRDAQDRAVNTVDETDNVGRKLKDQLRDLSIPRGRKREE
jgi:hypothetical protein